MYNTSFKRNHLPLNKIHAVRNCATQKIGPVRLRLGVLISKKPERNPGCLRPVFYNKSSTLGVKFSPRDEYSLHCSPLAALCTQRVGRGEQGIFTLKGQSLALGARLKNTISPWKIKLCTYEHRNRNITRRRMSQLKDELPWK
jgi:hypothetical protein